MMVPKKVSDKPKGSRKLLTIEQKKEIISAHERGVRIVDLAAKHGIASSSIATILKKKEEIQAASVAAGVKTLASQFQRSSVNEEMEKLLIIWINEHQMAGDTITQGMICSKARMIYEDLKKNVAGPSNAEAVEDFKGSRGWFEKFKRRSGIHSVIRHGEGASENKEEAEKFARKFQEWTINHGYKPEQVFNFDKTGFFWKQMPKRTFIMKEEKCMQPYKPMTDRITKECSSEEEVEDSNQKGRMPTGDVVKILHYWEEFQSLARKWYPNKAEMNRLCALVEDKCVNHFKNIMRKRKVESTLDRFLTSPPAKRQRPATEREEIFLE